MKTQNLKNRWAETIGVGALYWLGFGALVLSGYWLRGQMLDEPTHIKHILGIINNNYPNPSGLTNIPGYHAMMAGLGKVFGLESGATGVKHWRTASLALVSLGVGALWWFRRMDEPKTRALPVLLGFAACFPITKYNLLVYTTPAAISFLLVAGVLLANKKTILALIVSLATLSIRQDFIIYISLMWLYGGLNAISQAQIFSPKQVIAALRQHQATFWRFFVPFLLLVAAFVGFFVWNDFRIALNDHRTHTQGVFVENFYVFWVYLVVFCPSVVLQAPMGARKLWKSHKIGLVLLIISLFGLALWAYAPSHPFNNPKNTYRMVHTYVLTFFATSPAHTALLGAVSVVAALGLANAKHRINPLWALPFVFLSLSLHHLVTVRYVLPPLALFWFFRNDKPLYRWIDVVAGGFTFWYFWHQQFLGNPLFNF